MPQFIQQRVTGFGPPKRAIEVLSKDEANRFLEHARGGLLRDLVMIETSLLAGLRNAEVIGLNLEHVWGLGTVWRNIEVAAQTAKGHKARSVPMNPTLHADMVAYLDSLGYSSLTAETWRPLFFSRRGHRRLNTRDFQRITRTLGIESLGRPINPHLLRHTFATRLLASSNIRVVQLALGHVSLQSTERYLHPDSDEMSQAINSLFRPGAPVTEGGDHA